MTPRARRSPQAQAFLARPRSDAAGDQSLAARRQGLAAGQQRDIERFNTMYPATVADATIAGVPVRVVTPPNIPAAKKAHVLINLHGGGLQRRLRLGE